MRFFVCKYPFLAYIALFGILSPELSAAAPKKGKPSPAPAAKQPSPKTNASVDPLSSPDFNKQPTFVKADSLTLKATERYFLYSGNVEVKHGDMTMTSATLDGTYDQNNKILRMDARTNVVVIKGENIRVTGNHAHYEAATDSVTIDESPELTQNESVLTADTITIHLKENRSEASGQVRVKMVNKDGGALSSGSAK